VRGLLNKQIAFELGTVEKTIKVHRARVMQKMGVDSLAELVRIADKIAKPQKSKQPAAEQARNPIFEEKWQRTGSLKS
jgi:hypothetical protein